MERKIRTNSLYSTHTSFAAIFMHVLIRDSKGKKAQALVATVYIDVIGILFYHS